MLDALAGAAGIGAGDRGTVGSTGATLTVGLGGAAGVVVGALGWLCTGRGSSGLPTRVSTLDGPTASVDGEAGEGTEAAVGACDGPISACCMFA